MNDKPSHHQSGGVYIGGSVTARNIVGGSMTTGSPTIALDEALRPLMDAVHSAPKIMRDEAAQILDSLQKETSKGTNADDGLMATLLEKLIGLVPGAVSAVVSAFATPILGGIAGPVTSSILDKLRGK